MQHDVSLIGTQRITAHVAAYDNGRTPADGEPDRIVEVEVWQEADGTVVTDPERIAAIRAIQESQAKEN
jgi:hypothetical protein